MEAITENDIEQLTNQIESEPDNAEYYHRRGNFYHLLCKNEEAVKDHSKAIELDPDKYAGYYYHRGTCYLWLEKYDEALEDFNKAVGLSPDADCYFRRGVSYEWLEKYDEAAEDYKRAQELQPDNMDYIKSYLDCLSKMDGWTCLYVGPAVCPYIDGSNGRSPEMGNRIDEKWKQIRERISSGSDSAIYVPTMIILDEEKLGKLKPLETLAYIGEELVFQQEATADTPEAVEAVICEALDFLAEVYPGKFFELTAPV